LKMEPSELLEQIRWRLYEENNLEEALSDIFRAVSEIFSVWKIGWIQYHQELRLTRIIAQALSTGGELCNFQHYAPGFLVDLGCSLGMPDFYYINDPETDPIGREVSRRARLYDWSLVLIGFKNQTMNYGSLAILADGKERFTEEHTELFAPLREPFQLVLDALIQNDHGNMPDPLRKEPVSDKNAFFREVTRRLCGHLDLKTGVDHCLQYLSRFLPADALFVRQVEPELQSERILAESFGIFYRPSESLVPWKREEPRSGASRGLPETRIINQPERHNSVKSVSEVFGTDWSSISMPLIHKEAQVGIAVLSVEGRDSYSDDHMQMFSVLHDPFVLALSNNIKHREVLRLKDMIEAEKKGLQEELRDTRSQTIIGANLGLKGVVENSRLVAKQDSPVLLLGETGVGKEIVANFIHQKSSRASGPLVKVNCGGIPDTLLDSELFGHEKGAFTGAASRKVGRFERAEGGTIFLDEVGELPLQAQTRLLRVLQNKVIERVGGTETIPIDIRIIAATHRNLEEMVSTGRFREDLWFRLNVFPIRIPPLRSRRSDIPALVDHFIAKKSRELNTYENHSLSPGAMKRLTAYDWPGNVRELENVIERKLILSKGRPLTFQSLSGQPSLSVVPETDAGDDVFLDLDQAIARHIHKALALSHGKINGLGGAAELLKINPNTLRARMKKLGIAYGWKKNKVS